jgi:hypothetical protein
LDAIIAKIRLPMVILSIPDIYRNPVIVWKRRA